VRIFSLFKRRKYIITKSQLNQTPDMPNLQELARQAVETEKKIAHLTEQYGKLEAQLTKKGGSSGSEKVYTMSENQYKLLLKVKEVLIKEQREFEKMKSDGVALKEKNQQLQNEVKNLREELGKKNRTLDAVTLLAQIEQWWRIKTE